MPQINENRIIRLSNSSKGRVYHLNYPQILPPNVDFNQHLIARMGDIISIELHGLQFAKNDSIECRESNLIEVCLMTPTACSTFQSIPLKINYRFTISMLTETAHFGSFVRLRVKRLRLLFLSLHT